MELITCPRYHSLLEQLQSDPVGNVPLARDLIMAIAWAAFTLAILCLFLIYLHRCFARRADDNSDNPNLPNTCPSQSSDCNNPTFAVVVYNTPMTPSLPPPSSSSPSSSSPSCNESSFDQTTCSICLDEFKEGEELRVLPLCKHSFHKKCIEGWIPARSLHCPVCRDKVMGKKVETSRPDLHPEVEGLSWPYLTGFGHLALSNRVL